MLTRTEPTTYIRYLARKARALGVCDCFAFPAMHDNADVCSNWEHHGRQPCTDRTHQSRARYVNP